MVEKVGNRDVHFLSGNLLYCTFVHSISKGLNEVKVWHFVFSLPLCLPRSAYIKSKIRSLITVDIFVCRYVCKCLSKTH